MSTFLNKLDMVPLGNVSVLWMVLSRYLHRDDLFPFLSKSAPAVLQTYAVDIVYNERCPVCRVGHWGYATKKKLKASILDCYKGRSRLLTALCTNGRCDGKKIYGYLSMHRKGLVSTCRFNRKYSGYNYRSYMNMDEERRKSFAIEYNKLHQRHNPYQELIDKWWRK